MQREPSGSENFLHKLSAAIYNLRYILIGALAALVVVVITWAIVIEVRSNRNESSSVLAELAQDKLDAWIDEEDEEAKKLLAQDVEAETTRILESYPKMYAAQRAYHILGSLYFRNEQWEQAAASFLDLAGKFPKSYLAPVSVINAAVAYEEAGEDALAYETYRRITDEFVDVSPEVPRVLFSLARIKSRPSNITKGWSTSIPRVVGQTSGETV